MIGKTEIAVHRPLDAKALVPDVEFHDNNLVCESSLMHCTCVWMMLACMF